MHSVCIFYEYSYMFFEFCIACIFLQIIRRESIQNLQQQQKYQQGTEICVAYRGDTINIYHSVVNVISFADVCIIFMKLV